jgi:type VI secretion system protein ImpH
VRFRSQIRPVFPKSDVSDAEEPVDGGPARLTVEFMGAATPASWGSLPRRYAEELVRLVRDKNYALRDFIDLFNHRMISLFYRARERSVPTLALDRGRDNSFEHAIWGVLGIATPGLAGRLPLDDRMLAGRAGLLAMRPLGASALEGVIRSVFSVPVSIEQFVSGTYAIEADDRNLLGRQNSELGTDLYMGGELSLVQSKFRVRVGPLDGVAYEEMLPHRSGFRKIMDLIHFAVGEGFDYELQLVLRAEDAPAMTIGEPAATAPRLGWSSWLRTEPATEPADDLIFEPASDLAYSTRTDAGTTALEAMA